MPKIYRDVDDEPAGTRALATSPTTSSLGSAGAIGGSGSTASFQAPITGRMMNTQMFASPAPFPTAVIPAATPTASMASAVFQSGTGFGTPATTGHVLSQSEGYPFWKFNFDDFSNRLH